MTMLNPYLSFAGNADEAFDFYKSVFGGEFSSVIRWKDMPIEGISIPQEDAEKIMHIGLPVGRDQVLMGTDLLESLGQNLVQGNNLHISIHPDSREEADRIYAALSQGGKIVMPLAEQAWGDYYGDFRDKFGVQWMINYRRVE